MNVGSESEVQGVASTEPQIGGQIEELRLKLGPNLIPKNDVSAVLAAAIVAVDRLKVVETDLEAQTELIEELNTPQPPSAVTGVDANALEAACRRIAEQTHGVNSKLTKNGRVYEVTVPEADASLLRIATDVATT